MSEADEPLNPAQTETERFANRTGRGAKFLFRTESAIPPSNNCARVEALPRRNSVPFAEAAKGYGTHNLEREQLGHSGVLGCEKILCLVE
jgi:hypothetical protein